jgi:hypothetical protein
MGRGHWPATESQLLHLLRSETSLPEGLRRLLEHYDAPIQRFVTGTLNRYGLASGRDDVIQECLANAEQWVHDYDRSAGRFHKFFAGVLCNYVKRYVDQTYRKRGEPLEHAEALADPAPSVEDALERHYEQECNVLLVRLALTRTQEALDESDRGLHWRAFEAYHLSKLPSDQAVADALALEAPTADARRCRARRLRVQAEHVFRCQFRQLEHEGRPDAPPDAQAPA